MKPKRRFLDKFLSGEAHYGFWNVIAKGVGGANTFLIISSLTLYQYGVFQLLMSLYGVFADSVALGGGAINNEISRSLGSGNERRAKRIYFQYTTLRLVISLLLFSVFFFGAFFFADRYSVEFVKDMRLISFLFLTEFLVTSMKSLISLRLNFKAAASRTALYKIAQFAILLFFFLTGDFGLRGLLLSMIAASLFSILALVRPFLDAIRPWKGIDTKGEEGAFQALYLYGKWEVLRQFVAKISGRIQPWLIKVFVSTEAVAIFSVASSMIAVLKDAIPTKTLQALLPMRLEDPYFLRKSLLFAVKYGVVFSFVLMIGGAIFGGPLIMLLFAKYTPSLPYFYLMLLSLPFWTVGLIGGIYLVALRKQRFMFVHTTVRDIWKIIFYTVSLPIIGLWGLAIERIFTPIFLVSNMHAYMRKRLPDVLFHSKELFSFGSEDREFIRNVWNKVTSMTKNRLRFLVG